MTECTLRAFDGCRCSPGQCQSPTVRLARANAGIQAATFEKLRLLNRIYAFTLSAVVCFALGAWAAFNI
ncbi:hypothetical protein [Rhizobium sp. BK251]|uniref:hypothetical protein n=1 Tax=Rhizobium sp. BK251 TaxID=2512125 RepID=UPI00104286EE|nr:hypothetical protein [Rhizobium sp. BK251]TCL70609.1 hypothetical protein EV286_107486 [Rhizobium sp. BK251]